MGGGEMEERQEGQLRARQGEGGQDGERWGRVQLEALYLRAGRREPGRAAPGSPAQVRRRSGRSTGGARAGGGGGNPPPTRNCRLGREWTNLRDTPVSQALAPPSSKAPPLPLQLPPGPWPPLPGPVFQSSFQDPPSTLQGWTDSRALPGPFPAPSSLQDTPTV